MSAAALENWSSRSETVRAIRAYSQGLRVICHDLCLIMEGKHAVFPPELAEWVFDLPDGEIKAKLHLERLHAIAMGLESALNQKLLTMGEIK